MLAPPTPRPLPASPNRGGALLSFATAQGRKRGRQMPGTETPPRSKDLQSPGGRGCGRCPGPGYGDSPGDVEPSQDIIWDPTSPTQANAGSGLRNIRVVEISDIVNRIAPKDVKPKGTDSPLLQWIGDSAVPCTPEIPGPRCRKKSSRQSSVEDLMKLARQFDKNMQQDKETAEQLNAISADRANTTKINLTEAPRPGSVKDPRLPSSADEAEAELHALFDCSTQRVSGPLSQGLSTSAPSQEMKDQPGSRTLAEPRQSEPKSASAARPAEKKRARGFTANNCDDLDDDDDWDNDDLLNDSLVLAMAQNPEQKQDTSPKATLQANTKTSTPHLTSVCKPTANMNSAHQPSNLHSKPSCSLLQELCPKPKTTNRSTFKLESNPLFQPKRAAKEVSKCSFTVTQPKSQMSDQESVTTKTLAAPQPDKIADDQSGARIAAESVKDISDSLWDDGDDDALLYQACDSVERISKSQTQQASPGGCQEKQDMAADVQRRTTTAPLLIHQARSTGAGATGQSPCSFVRSYSLPGTGCETVDHRGWNIPMKGANNKPRMSQSLPGSCGSLGTFSQGKDPSGTFQGGNANADPRPQTVTARGARNSKSHHVAFKRNISDSAAMSSKVFVTSQMTGKCSAAEIERKKQEALARRRLRMQNTPKP